jgi:uncharacterized protein (TIGR02266 family)
MEMVDQSNQRHSERKRFAASLRFVVEGDANFYTGLVRNISDGGVFVHTYNLPDLGSEIQVRFRVPYLNSVADLVAEVVWARPHDAAAHPEDVGFGARFKDLPPEVEAAINRYLKEIEPQFFV